MSHDFRTARTGQFPSTVTYWRRRAHRSQSWLLQAQQRALRFTSEAFSAYLAGMHKWNRGGAQRRSAVTRVRVRSSGTLQSGHRNCPPPGAAHRVVFCSAGPPRPQKPAPNLGPALSGGLLYGAPPPTLISGLFSSAGPRWSRRGRACARPQGLALQTRPRPQPRPSAVRVAGP